jgi:hypothetical protein
MYCILKPHLPANQSADAYRSAAAWWWGTDRSTWPACSQSRQSWILPRLRYLLGGFLNFFASVAYKLWIREHQDNLRTTRDMSSSLYNENPKKNRSAESLTNSPRKGG